MSAERKFYDWLRGFVEALEISHGTLGPPIERIRQELDLVDKPYFVAPKQEADKPQVDDYSFIKSRPVVPAPSIWPGPTTLPYVLFTSGHDRGDGKCGSGFERAESQPIRNCDAAPGSAC